MFTCSGRYNRIPGTITIGEGYISFSNIKEPGQGPSSFSFGGRSYPAGAQNAEVPEPSTFDFAGRTFLTGDRPTSISIPVQAIFEMSVEEVVPDLYEVAWGYTYTSKLVLLVDTEVVPGHPRHELEALNAQELSDAIKTEMFMINKKTSLHDSDDRVFLRRRCGRSSRSPANIVGPSTRSPNKIATSVALPSNRHIIPQVEKVCASCRIHRRPERNGGGSNRQFLGEIIYGMGLFHRTP